MGIPRESQNIILSDMYGTGFLKIWHDIFKRTMLPGQAFHNFTEGAPNELSVQLHHVDTEVDSIKRWLDVLVLRVGTTALWGKNSPFRVDPSLENTFR